MAIEGAEKYDFLQLVAVEESIDSSNKDIAETMVEDDNLALMVGASSNDEDNSLLDFKVSFEKVKVNIHSYSKKNLESL